MFTDHPKECPCPVCREARLDHLMTVFLGSFVLALGVMVLAGLVITGK
jgi:hypothetical protein